MQAVKKDPHRTAAEAVDDPMQSIAAHPLGTVLGAIAGALLGGLIGIAAGPVGSLLMAIGGAVLGGAIGAGRVGGKPVIGPVAEPSNSPERPDDEPPADLGQPRTERSEASIHRERG
jgi:phage tail tape-measure protein